MKKAKNNDVVKHSLKKELKKKIAFQLTDTLVELKNILGDKKFNNRIRKASKLLSSGIKNKKAISVVKGKRKSKAQAKSPVESKADQVNPNPETSSD